MTTDPQTGSTDRRPFREEMTRRLINRSQVSGELSLPAVPGMLDEYLALCDDLFARVGRKFNEAELAKLKDVLEGQLAIAFEASPRSNILVTYNAAIAGALNYHVKAQWWPLEVAYENWTQTRKPPLFGTEPDARVWALANDVADPATHPVLDIGAGTGRNALALARRGHPVDAVEITPKFAETIRAEAESESLNVRVIQRDVFATTDDLRRDYGLILLSEVVPDFRTPEQLRSMFELAAQCLAGGGRLVFNIFLGRMGYEPDDAARQFGQQCYSNIFTTEELGDAVSDLPLQLTSDDSVYRYEKAHLPHGAWPPTGWYADWVSGLDVFPVPRDESPIELRWLVYQKPTW
jgi:SAM-dependent methyltransferase